MEQLVDLLLLSAHGVEVLGGDALTTGAEGLDEARVVEGEDDVGDLVRVLARVGLAALAEELVLGPLVVGDPLVEFLFDLSLQLLLEGEGGSLVALKGTTGSAIDVFFPVQVVLLLNRKLDREVASGHGGDVPFELNNLAALEHVSDGDRVEHGNQEGCANGKSHLVVLDFLLGGILHARVLNEQRRILFTAACNMRFLQRLATEVEEVRLSSDGGVEARSNPRRVGLAGSVEFVRLAVVLALDRRAHTVVVDLADCAVGAGEGKAANAGRDLSALDAGVAEVSEV